MSNFSLLTIRSFKIIFFTLKFAFKNDQLFLLWSQIEILQISSGVYIAPIYTPKHFEIFDDNLAPI